MVEFKEINEDNFSDVIQLSIHESQSLFVSPVVKSLAECWLYRKNQDVFPFAIYDESKLVGFILFDEDVEAETYMIWRFLIDKKYQGKGLGRQVILRAIEITKQRGLYKQLHAHAVVGNEAVKYLLQDCGFVVYGFDEEHQEVMMSFDLSQTM